MAVRAERAQGAAAPAPQRLPASRPLRPLNALCAAKRKSAVELLQESKAFYVKSDSVRDGQQRLQRPTSVPVAGAIISSPPLPSSALLSPPPSPLLSPCSGLDLEPMPPAPPGFQQDSGPCISPKSVLLPKSPRLGCTVDTPRLTGTTWTQRRAASQQLQSDRLQTKLRRLLNADSKENVCYDDSPDREKDQEDIQTVAGEGATHIRQYGRCISQNQHPYSSRTLSAQAACSLHKSLPDLHSSPAPKRHTVPRWSLDNSSTRGSSASSHSGDFVGGFDNKHRRGGSQRGHVPLHYSGDAMSVVSSGGHTHRSQRREGSGELRRGESSGSSTGARTNRSQPEGRTRANTVSEALIRQSSGGSTVGLSGLSSWSPRCRSRTSSQYQNLRNSNQAFGDDVDSRVSRGSGSRGSCGSHGSLGSRDSSHENDHDNVFPQPNTRVAELCWNFEPRRPILRSKSDISHRYSGSANIPLSPPCQDPAQLEVFFEQLGLDSTEYQYVSSQGHSHSSDSPVYFSSVSSVDSTSGAWNTPWNSHGTGQSNSAAGTGGAAGGLMGSGHSGKNIEQPSIVERNARIIKWLCNCRKAQKEMYQALGNGNVS